MIDITYRSSKSTRNTNRVTKRIQVHSNDSSNPVISLKIQARANMPQSKFSWNPDKAEFDEVLIGKKDKFKLELQNKDSLKVELEVVSEPNDKIIKKYKIKRTSLDPEQTTEIEFELRDDLPPGDFKTSLTLQQKNSDQDRLSIPIMGKVVETLSPPKPVAASGNKKPAVIQPAKTKKDAEPKTEIQIKNPTGSKQASSKPASKPIPLTTIDDSDLK